MFLIVQHLHSVVSQRDTNNAVQMLDNDEHQSECERNVKYQNFSNAYVIILFSNAWILWKGYAMADVNQAFNPVFVSHLLWRL